MVNVRKMWVVGLLFAAAACGGQDVQETEAVASEEETANMSGTITFGTTVKLTEDATLYSAADPHSTKRKSMYEGKFALVVHAYPSNGYYNVNYYGTVGWVTGAVLKVSDTPDNAIERATARARSAQGFSYWWGGEKWSPTSQSPGTCTGTCGKYSVCTHTGNWGSDCSGLIAKAWKVRSCDSLTETCDNRPVAASYTRTDPNGEWRVISRSSVSEGDALATSSHVAYYVKEDERGTPFIVECQGCDEGCLQHYRSLSGYTASRRNW